MRSAFLLALALLVVGSARAVTDPAVRLQPLVQTYVTPVPEGSPGETFSSVAFPAVHQGNVVFVGLGTDGTQGVYCYCDGFLTAAATTDDPVPGLPDGVVGTFDSFSLPVIYEDEIVMTGAVILEGLPNFAGLYSWTPSGLSVVLDRWTELPLGQSGDFVTIKDLSLDEAGLTFLFPGGIEPGGEDHDAVYRYQKGEFETLVSRSTPFPNDPPGPFLSFGNVFADGPGFTLTGRSLAGRGVVKSIGGELSLVADHQTQVPGGEPGEVFQFLNLAEPVIGNGTVLFFAATSVPLQGGFYRERNGELQEVVTRRTINPLTGTLFNEFDNKKTADGDAYALVAGTDNDTPFYGDANDRLYAIATEGEELEGQEIQFIFLGKHAISGNQLAFEVFRFGEELIYLATIGENTLEVPTLGRGGLAFFLLLLAAGGLLVLRRTG